MDGEDSNVPGGPRVSFEDEATRSDHDAADVKRIGHALDAMHLDSERPDLVQSSSRKSSFRRGSSGSIGSYTSRVHDENSPGDDLSHTPPTIGPKPILKRPSNQDSDCYSSHPSAQNASSSSPCASSCSIAIVNTGGSSGGPSVPMVVDLSKPPPPSILKKRNSFEVRNPEIHPILKRHSIGGIGSSTMSTSPSSGSLGAPGGGGGYSSSHSGSPFANTPDILDSPLSSSPSASHHPLPGPALIALNQASGGALFDELSQSDPNTSNGSYLGEPNPGIHSILKNQSSKSPSFLIETTHMNANPHATASNQSLASPIEEYPSTVAPSIVVPSNPSSSSSGPNLIPKPILKKKVSVDEKSEKTIHFVSSIDLQEIETEPTSSSPTSNHSSSTLGCISSASSGYASGDELSFGRTLMPKPILKKNKSTEDFTPKDHATDAEIQSTHLSQPIVRPRRRSQDDDTKFYEVVEIIPDIPDPSSSSNSNTTTTTTNHLVTTHRNSPTDPFPANVYYLGGRRHSASTHRGSYSIKPRSKSTDDWLIKKEESYSGYAERSRTPILRATSEIEHVPFDDSTDDPISCESPSYFPPRKSSLRHRSRSPRPPIRERSKSDNSWERRCATTGLRPITPLSAPPSRSMTVSSFGHSHSSLHHHHHHHPRNISATPTMATTGRTYLSQSSTESPSISPTRLKVVANIGQFLEQTTDAALSRSAAAAAAASGATPSSSSFSAGSSKIQKATGSPHHTHHHPHHQTVHHIFHHHPHALSSPSTSSMITTSIPMPSPTHHMRALGQQSARSPPPPSRSSGTPSPIEHDLDLGPDPD